MKNILQIASVFLVKHGLTYVSIRGAVETYSHHYQNVGGKVDSGEKILQAAARETLEETALKINLSRFKKITKTRCFSESGSPYDVTSFVVHLRKNEVPVTVEKNKCGPWMLIRPVDLHLIGPMVPSLLSSAKKAFKL